MNRLQKLICLLLGLALCLGLSAALSESQVNQEVYALVPCEGGQIKLLSTMILNEWESYDCYLFLPAFAQNADVEYWANGQPFQPQWEAGEEEGTTVCQLPDGSTVYCMCSENLRTLFLYSDDPENQGRLWLEDCEEHERSITGSMALVDADGMVDHAGDVKKLRGRGNSTWPREKKPYQMNLADKADLLNVGEKSRKWVLLADAMDKSLLHNRITFDLGLELGLEETSHSEHIDLYFDGEYRGTYLLCEKVEIGEGRVEETDYEKIIEKWSEKAGQDLDALSIAQGQNGYGQNIWYIDGLEAPDDPGAGAYLLELDNRDEVQCSFNLSNGLRFILKNPEYASENMVSYVSQRLQEALNTLQNGGVNPDTGRTLEEDFDVDSFARTALIHELAYNLDGFTLSSSFFVLPAGSQTFRAGPLWDFDLAWRERANGYNENGVGTKNHSGWLAEMYSVEAFAQRLAEIYEQELYPLLQNVLLGDGEGRYLKSLTAYDQEIAASRRMNDRLYPADQNERLVYGADGEQDVEVLRTFIAGRSQWMNEFLQTLLDCEKAQPAAVDLMALTWATHMEDTFVLSVQPWSKAQVVEYTLEQVSEATEEEYAVWRLKAVLAPGEEQSFAPDVYVLLNSQSVSAALQEDGTLLVDCLLNDLSYRPVDYDGDDVGLVFDYDWYVKNHPALAEKFDYDQYALLEDFFMEGVYEGRQGNRYFRPKLVAEGRPDVYDMLGETWEMYYWDFMDYGWEDGWVLNYGSAAFRPTVKEEP